MNQPLSSALHPLSFAFADQLSGGAGRARQLEQWRRVHGPGVEPPPARLVGEHPLVASAALQRDIDRQLAELTAFLALSQPTFQAEVPQWPGLPVPDVISADLAITVDPSAPEGWSLRWVEFQAFTSIISTMHTLRLAAETLWPAARDLAAWRLPDRGGDWLASVRDWVAPHGGILLEHAPHAQGTRFDLQAAARIFSLPIVEPHQLLRGGPALLYEAADGARHAVHHVFNRLVMHELADRLQFEQEVAGAGVTWHSHPAWYYGISKAWLPRLPQRDGARCAYATDWRSLGFPAEALVAKNVNSHGGAAVHLHVDARMLDSLDQPDTWLVQPRYTPQALFGASDGAPVYGEIRCIVARPCSSSPWVASQLMRLSRASKVSAAGLTEAPGSGLAILYRPPGF